jgi:hypothetical protein
MFLNDDEDEERAHDNLVFIKACLAGIAVLLICKFLKYIF